MTVAVGLGAMVVIALLVAKWVNRHADRQDNGGHHQREDVKPPGRAFEFVR